MGESLTILYIIVGGLVIISLGLYVLLRVLNKKKQEHKKRKRKIKAVQEVVEAQGEPERSFIPSGGGPE